MRYTRRMRIRVLQWNVWYREYADNIISELRRFAADIVCLQELTTDSYCNPGVNVPLKIAELGYEFEYFPTLNRPGTHHYKMGNGIFSKYPVVNSRRVFVARESDDRENRVYLEVELETSAGRLWVGTTHLSWIESEPLDEAEKLVEATAKRTSRFILTGDLNVAPGSRVLQKIENQLLNATSTPVLTWPSKPYEGHGLSIRRLDRQLDYVFTTPDIKVLSTRALESAHSDHLPLLTELEI